MNICKIDTRNAKAPLVRGSCDDKVNGTVIDNRETGLIKFSQILSSQVKLSGFPRTVNASLVTAIPSGGSWKTGMVAKSAPEL